MAAPPTVVERARASLDALEASLGLSHSAAEELVQSTCLPLAESLAARAATAGRCLVVGLSGAQGTGKSTIAAFTRVLLEEGCQLRTCVVSLDDYYLPKDARRQLAREVHPLLATRGVPGTHAVDALHAVLRRLRSAASGERVELLQFSKAHDDRLRETRPVVGPFDLVLFEGWCVGARATDRGDAQVLNALERDEDSDGTWRRFVDAQLAQPYAALWSELDLLVYLAVPDFDVVQALRREQEQKLRASAQAGASGVMSDARLRRFIEHFERVTRQMLESTPSHADIVVHLDADRSVRQRVT